MAVMSTSSKVGSSSGMMVGDFDFVKAATPERSDTCGDYIQCAVAGVPGLVCTKWRPRVSSTDMTILAPLRL